MRKILSLIYKLLTRQSLVYTTYLKRWWKTILLVKISLLLSFITILHFHPLLPQSKTPLNELTNSYTIYRNYYNLTFNDLLKDEKGEFNYPLFTALHHKYRDNFPEIIYEVRYLKIDSITRGFNETVKESLIKRYGIVIYKEGLIYTNNYSLRYIVAKDDSMIFKDRIDSNIIEYKLSTDKVRDYDKLIGSYRVCAVKLEFDYNWGFYKYYYNFLDNKYSN